MEPRSTKRAEDRVQYERMLRVIGKYLDDAGASRFQITEIPFGLALRYEVKRSRLSQQAVTFAWSDLESRDADMERRRREAVRQWKVRFPGSTSEPPQQSGPYQDLLRSLGHELEGTQAYTVALDELDDGLLVTYVCLNPRANWMPRKRMVFLRLGEQDTILHDAFHRRGNVANAARLDSTTLLG